VLRDFAVDAVDVDAVFAAEAVDEKPVNPMRGNVPMTVVRSSTSRRVGSPARTRIVIVLDRLSPVTLQRAGADARGDRGFSARRGHEQRTEREDELEGRGECEARRPAGMAHGDREILR
jgi:hypothetical protein